MDEFISGLKGTRFIFPYLPAKLSPYGPRAPEVVKIRTRTMAPGEEEQVTITIPMEYLTIFNGNCWIVEEGLYEIRVGASLRDVRLKAVVEMEDDVYFDLSRGA